MVCGLQGCVLGEGKMYESGVAEEDSPGLFPVNEGMLASVIAEL